MYHLYFKKVKSIYTALPKRKQGEIIRMVTNEEIIDELSKIENLRSLTGYPLHEMITFTNSTSTSKKHELIKFTFESVSTPSKKIEQSGLSITTLKISYKIIFNYLRKNSEIIDNCPELLL